MTEHGTLRIWQQNVNKSLTAMDDLLHSASPADYDILAIQEPYLDHALRTRATRHWRVHYPTVRDPETTSRMRSVILVNAKLSTNAWSPITIPSPDVTAITFRTQNSQIHIFNLYVDIESDAAIHATTRATLKLNTIAIGAQQRLVWLGDFNRHHPQWDNPANAHLFTSSATA